MPAYMRSLWRSGLCPHLVPAGFYEENGILRIRLNREGLTSVQAYAAACPDGLEGSFCFLLQALTSAASSFAALQSWLAEPSHISLAPEDLYYDRKTQRSLLVFSEDADPQDFLPRFLTLCHGLGGSGRLIGERLEQAASSCILEEKGTARFLSSWRQQILAPGR